VIEILFIAGILVVTTIIAAVQFQSDSRAGVSLDSQPAPHH
jgi:hypothetical protein